MLLTPLQKSNLLKNWGDKADSLTCNAEVRAYDPLSKWCVYLLAMNPENEDAILCLFTGILHRVDTWTITELEGCFNEHGEGLENDMDYRPVPVQDVIRALEESYVKLWSRPVPSEIQKLFSQPSRLKPSTMTFRRFLEE